MLKREEIPLLRFKKRQNEQIDRSLGGSFPPWQEELLLSRGITTFEQGEAFLNPQLQHLHDPFLMRDMDKAVARIQKAIANREKIVIYGDYDVDGMCATSILLETFWQLGALADFYIPSRHEEGYGLNSKAVQKLAGEYDLMVTVDCGINAHNEVKLAMDLGLDVIVTDHHQLPQEPVVALAVLNPLISPYPFGKLCGAGVAGKLAQALGGEALFQTKLDLIALATVADLVPLVEENRVLVHYGLKAMESPKRLGIQKLKEAAGLKPGPVRASQVAFTLAPRLNAAGRLADATKGVTLFTTGDEALALETALYLHQENGRRQEIEKQMLSQALEVVENMDLSTLRSLVVAGEGWNSGVVGLVASRLVEKYAYPTVVLSNQEGELVGSARSIPGINIYQALLSCSHLFTRFGGHEQAAGLSMPKENLPAFVLAFDQAVKDQAEEDSFIPVKEYDMALDLEQVTLETVTALKTFQPTGYGNPEPVFLLEDSFVQEARRIGKEGEHLKVVFSKGQQVREGIAFRQGDMAPLLSGKVQALFVPQLNEFQGRVTPQCLVKALQPLYEKLPDHFINSFTLEQGLIEDFQGLLSNNNKRGPAPKAHPFADWRRDFLTLLKGSQGTLLLARTAQRAQDAYELAEGKVDIAVHTVKQKKGYHTLLTAPKVNLLNNWWQQIVLLDGPLCPQELKTIHARCPRAKIYTVNEQQPLRKMLNALAVEDEPLRGLYRVLRREPVASLQLLGQKAGLSPGQTLVGLISLSQVKLLCWQPAPFTYTLLPPAPCNIGDGPFLGGLRKARDHINKKI